MLVDIEDNANSILQLNVLGVRNNFTVILSWSEMEAARYLETFKSNNDRQDCASNIRKRESTDPLERVSDFLTSGGRSGVAVNKTDSVTLLNSFGTVFGISQASRDELSLCVGMGPLKVRRLHDAFHKPFSKLKTKERKEKEEKQKEELEEQEKRQKKMKADGGGSDNTGDGKEEE